MEPKPGKLELHVIKGGKEENRRLPWWKRLRPWIRRRKIHVMYDERGKLTENPDRSYTLSTLDEIHGNRVFLIFPDAEMLPPKLRKTLKNKEEA